MMKYSLIPVLILILVAGLTACSGKLAATTTSSLETVTTSLSSTYPVEIVSVASTYKKGQIVNPGGPEIEITLKNVSDKNIVTLEVTLKEYGDRSFDFEFSVTALHPLKPDKQISLKRTLIGGGWGDGIPYALEISGVMEGGKTFAFTWESPGQSGPSPSTSATPKVIAFLNGNEVTIIPGPGTFLQNSQNESFGVMLIDTAAAMGICEQQYTSPWATPSQYKEGDPCIILSGRVLNTDKERPELAMWAVGYDETGQQVSWTIDAHHIAGQISLRVEYNETGDFTIHMNPVAGLRTIRIFLNGYNFPPP